MKKTAFLFPFLFLFFQSYAQDSVIYRKGGRSVPLRIQGYDKERVYFKNFEDPEFATQSVPLNKIAYLWYEGGEKVRVRNNLAGSFIGLDLGRCIPVSYYANNQLQNSPTSGSAKTGGYMSIYGGFYIYRNFGLQVSGRFFQNPYDASGYRTIYQNGNNSGNGFVTDIHTSDWRSASFNIDLMYTFRFSDKWMLDVFAGIGSAKVHKPELELDYTVIAQTSPKADTSRYSFVSHGTTTDATMISTGLRLKYKIGKHLALTLGITSQYANARFGYTSSTKTSFNGNTSVDAHSEWHQSIAVSNLHVGICYVFNRNLIKR